MQYKRLSDCAKIKFCSVTLSRSKPRSAPSRWLAGACFLADNEVDFDPSDYNIVPDDDLRLNKDDIVIKRVAPTYVNYIDFDPGEVYCGSNLIIVSPNHKSDAKYLAMVLNDTIAELSKESSVGAVLKSISRYDLEALEIPMADEKDRPAIGELWYLSTKLKKKKIRLAELENTRTYCLINKSLHISGGRNDG